MEGWIGIPRNIMDHWIYKDAEYLKVWLEMIFRARFSKQPTQELIDGQLITIGYAEFIFGRISWSDRLGISEQRLRTLLRKLQKEEMIELVEKLPRFSLYRVKVFENYRNFNQQSNQQVNQQNTQQYQEIEAHANQHNNHVINQRSTSSQPASNQQPTTKEESKESNKDKKEYKTSTTTNETNVFRIYENEGFGLLSPMNAERLGDFIDTYGERWTSEALKEASYHSKRSLPYVSRILETWKTSGVDEPWKLEKPKQQSTPQNRNYTPTNRGKPQIRAVPSTAAKPSASKVTEAELEEMLKKARKLDEMFNTPKPVNG
ncbi:DnaD domain-containing protein [Paenibacillus chitinolyticus]